MTTNVPEPAVPTKRADVGYKRPPVEHQFKKGQKPPPRKPKAKAEKESSRELLERLLNEPRRVVIDGKPAWRTTATLVMHRAYEAAEQGNHTLQRLLSELHFAGEPTGPLGPIKRMFIKERDGTFTPVEGNFFGE